MIGDGSEWQGLDIATCAVNKVAMATAKQDCEAPLRPHLIIGGKGSSYCQHLLIDNNTSKINQI